MKRRRVLVFYPLSLLFALVGIAKAADESFLDQFLGSPLLSLTAIIVIVIIAFIYHKIKK